MIVTPPTSKYDNVQINTQNPLMSKALVRQAMSFAFDRESVVRDILYGFGSPAVCPFPATNWACDAATCDYLVFDLESRCAARGGGPPRRAGFGGNRDSVAPRLP